MAQNVLRPSAEFAEETKALSREAFAARYGPAFLLVAEKPEEAGFSAEATALTLRPELDGPPVAAMFLALQAVAVAPEAPQDGALNLTIGRSAANHVVLPFASISKRHAIVSRGGPGEPWRIEDSGSRYGTELSGRRLMPGEKREIGDGTAVSLGDVQLIFRTTHAYYDLLKAALELKDRKAKRP